MGKPEYTGIMDEPIDPDAPEDEVIDQLMKRFGALADYYGVKDLSQESLINLVYGLAFDHVRGFRVPRQIGTKPIRAVAERDAIIIAKLRHAKNKAKAADDLADNHPDWKINAKSIRTRYYALMSGDREGQALRRRVAEEIVRRDSEPRLAYGPRVKKL